MIYQINMRVAPFLINFEKNDQIVFQNFTSLPFLFPFFFHLSLNCVFCATNTEMFLTNLFNLFTCLNCYFLPLPLLPLSFMFLPIHSFFTFFFFFIVKGITINYPIILEKSIKKCNKSLFHQASISPSILDP